MASVLVACTSRYGSTREVADVVADALREHGLAVQVTDARQVRSFDGVDAVVLGTALYMYRWHKDARRFLAKHRHGLARLPVAVFTLGPTHDPHDEAEWSDCREQLDRELERVAWLDPVAPELFGGRFDPAGLRFPISAMAGKEPATDIRDWDAIRAWAGRLPQAFGASLV